MDEITLKGACKNISVGNEEDNGSFESNQSLAAGDVQSFTNANSDNDIKWKNLSWWQCSAIMLVSTFVPLELS